MSIKIGVDIDGTIAKWPDNTQEWDDLTVLELPTFKGAVKVLNKWAKQGIEPVYITFRRHRSANKTIRWLISNEFPNPREVLFGENFIYKSDVVKDLNAIGMIDDDEYVINDCAKKGQHAFLHIMPYTERKLVINSPKIIPWNTWDELDKIIPRIAKMV